ncbi:hypothetical protein INT08_03185 [Prosthecochloris sp. N3]|uniref:Type II secretion system protein GspG C-terminal domain-containing protein n=1 Tax=Prosthecochloris ethylica TaxID=2743976 RepID=A0ABR9XQR9_9CHLB|nr:hypothetical protein [Prosthecochloris ethylica]MBF0585402.1 hypothetical protein [Prosthecochloris ethylica]MBF0636188.1 hypothetical protein [Prosthecochloris ethylica]NUK46631.1 hypothetical protein [Prosthecochloris ethylica]
MKRVGKGWVLGVAVSLLVAAAVVRGLFMIGPIEEQRNRRFDERRLADLQRIASSVEFYYRSYDELPESLNALERLPESRVPRLDPESGEPYTYRRISAEFYELCATFALESGESTGLRWAHKAGPACFRLRVRR